MTGREWNFFFPPKTRETSIEEETGVESVKMLFDWSHRIMPYRQHTINDTVNKTLSNNTPLKSYDSIDTLNQARYTQIHTQARSQTTQ